MSSSNAVRLSYKKETTYGVTPAGVKAFRVIQELTYTAVKAGTQGNSITITYTGGATAGAEVVTVLGNAISIQIEDGVSTATQVKTAYDLVAAAIALATVAITGTASNAQEFAGVSALALQTGAGEFKTVRFISEELSGSPETTESQQIRTDRMSSGQVVTGLTVGGNHSFELAKEEALEDFMESAMYNAWVVSTIVNDNFEIDIDLKKLIRVSGSFVTEGVKVGDFITLSNFATAANNTIVMATSVSALELTFVGPTGMVDAVSEAASYKIADKLTIGTTKKSLSIEKAFTDLTTKAINYRGMIAASMELNIEYGALISGSFGFSGNDYVTADAASEFMTYQHYITDAATTNTLNGSVDMPFLATNVTGSWLTDSFCIQSLNLNLNNNLTTQTCIGNIAPEDYTPGTAQIEASLSSYLKDGNWDLLARKLSQDSFGLGFMVKNTGGWYGFYVPALQVSFDDPNSEGANQDVSMDMSGQAKVGSNGESAITLYRSA